MFGLPKFSRGDLIKYVSLVVLVVQTCSLALFMNYVQRRKIEKKFISSVAIFFQEIVKLISCIVIVSVQQRSLRKCFKLMYTQIILEPIDTLIVMVPAVVYVIQNNLIWFANKSLNSATFLVVYQLKILTTAFFMVVILRRPLSLPQWLALLVLFAGVVFVKLDEKALRKVSETTATVFADATADSTVSPVPQDTIWGFLAVLLAAFLSGFAGIYLEKIFKTTDVSIWIRNIQLAIVSLPVALATALIKDYTRMFADGFMGGFDIFVWITVFIASAGGLLVAIVIKYADNILKGFSTSIAIVIGSILSALLFAFAPGYLFMSGAVLVIAAVFMYIIFPYKNPEPQNQPANEPKPESEQEPKSEPEKEPKPELENQPKPEFEEEPKPEPENQPKPESEEELNLESDYQPKPESEKEPKPMSEKEPKPVSEKEPKPMSEKEPMSVSENEPKAKPANADPASEAETQASVKMVIGMEGKNSDVVQEAEGKSPV